MKNVTDRIANVSWITRRSPLSVEVLSDSESDYQLARRATYTSDNLTMASHVNDPMRSSGSESVRQQLYRSTSELPHSSKLHRHHRPHLHRRDKEEKVDRALGSSLHHVNAHDGPKSEWATPTSSHNGSRRTSLFTSPDDILAGMEWQREKKIVREGEVKAESEKSAKRVVELRRSLLELNTLSNSFTSRLDNSYYSVLEKLSTLNDIITSLKDLALMTRQLNDDFVKESSSAAKEIGTQLDAFSGFTAQEQKIKNLEQRIGAGRERAQILACRVEATKQKIDRWEKVEGEWQERTRKRLKILWGITAVTLMILASLMIFQFTPARTQGPGVLRGLDVSDMAVNLSEMESKLEAQSLRMKRSAVSALERLRAPAEDGMEDDPRLRAFDEL